MKVNKKILMTLSLITVSAIIGFNVMETEKSEGIVSGKVLENRAVESEVSVEGVETKVDTEDKKRTQRSELKVSRFATPAKFMNKIIFTRAERAEIQAFYEDKELIEKAVVEVNDTERMDRPEVMEERLRALNYLLRAVEFKDNAYSEEIKMNLFNFLKNKNIEEVKGRRARKMVLGDKIDILKKLKVNAPELYEQFKSEVSEEEFAKINKYINA